LEFGSKTAGNQEEFVKVSLLADILIPQRFQHVASVLPPHVTAVLQYAASRFYALQIVVGNMLKMFKR